MNRSRADGESWGCHHPPKRAGGAGGSKEIGNGFGAGTGSEVDWVGVGVGVDAGVTCGERSEDVGSASVGAEAGRSVKPEMSEPWSGKVVGAVLGAVEGGDAHWGLDECAARSDRRDGRQQRGR